MRDFAALYNRLLDAKAAGDKTDALTRYLRTASQEDAAWAVSLVLGDHSGRIVSPKALRVWAADAGCVPLWLVERCYAASGDLSETAALLAGLPDLEQDAPSAVAEGAPTASPEAPLAWLMGVFIPSVALMDEQEKQRAVLAAWLVLGIPERIILNKLLTGSLRMRAGRSLVERALAEISGTPRERICRRLDAGFRPTSEEYLKLAAPPSFAEPSDCTGVPYPFQQVTPVDPESLTDTLDEHWCAEYLASGGVRVQVVRQSGCTSIWSDNHENLTPYLPELAAAGDALPDETIIEGTILAAGGLEKGVDTAALLKQRKSSAKASPARGECALELAASDLLQHQGRDIRTAPLAERRRLLIGLLDRLPEALPVRLAAELQCGERGSVRSRLKDCRASGASGILLKRLDSHYGGADESDTWLFLPAEPHAIVAVLLYAEAMRGQAAHRFGNFTFGVWAAPGGERLLVPITKTNLGLPDAGRRAIDRFVLRHTVERHGPVRVVEPSLAVKLAFDDVEHSARHKSGLTLIGARAVQLLAEMPAANTDTLERVRGLMRGDAPTLAADTPDG